MLPRTWTEAWQQITGNLQSQRFLVVQLFLPLEYAFVNRCFIICSLVILYYFAGFRLPVELNLSEAESAPRWLQRFMRV